MRDGRWRKRNKRREEECGGRNDNRKEEGIMRDVRGRKKQAVEGREE